MTKQQEEWEEIGDYIDLVRKYFTHDFNPMSLINARFRNCGEGIEIVREDRKSGYTFVGELQLDRDVEARLNRVRIAYESEGRVVDRLFLDLRAHERIGGLAWTKK